mmetsp:Transcript_3040/g.12287  ORF Transcript_3040/g.12287 Transcript_3040/m.12287 type:complete len:285 (-) Transcript_3040:79-933(-)
MHLSHPLEEHARARLPAQVHKRLGKPDALPIHVQLSRIEAAEDSQAVTQRREDERVCRLYPPWRFPIHVHGKDKALRRVGRGVPDHQVADHGGVRAVVIAHEKRQRGRGVVAALQQDVRLQDLEQQLRPRSKRRAPEEVLGAEAARVPHQAIVHPRGRHRHQLLIREHEGSRRSLQRPEEVLESDASQRKIHRVAVGPEEVPQHQRAAHHVHVALRHLATSCRGPPHSIQARSRLEHLSRGRRGDKQLASQFGADESNPVEPPCGRVCRPRLSQLRRPTPPGEM